MSRPFGPQEVQVLAGALTMFRALMDQIGDGVISIRFDELSRSYQVELRPAAFRRCFPTYELAENVNIDYTHRAFTRIDDTLFFCLIDRSEAPDWIENIPA